MLLIQPYILTSITITKMLISVELDLELKSNAHHELRVEGMFKKPYSLNSS
jgi:hypothetical protein